LGRSQLVRLDMSGRLSQTAAAPSRPRAAGESQMAVTAIDHGGRVVTVTSQPVAIPSPDGTSQDLAFATNIHGGFLNDTIWQATSWVASLRNHASAVSQVIDAIALSADSDG
jgi:hypothetical protein